MSYSAQKLITKAFNLSGVVSRSLQTVTGQQLSDGLELLNLILSTKAYDKGFIPYFNEYTFNAVIGQEMYYVPNLVEIETLTYNIGDVRFPSYKEQRKRYFGGPRVDRLNSLPFKWHAERCLDGTNIYLYFSPAGAYPMKLWGKFAFDDVTQFTDMLIVFDSYYVNYLKYELAASICNDMGIPVQPQVASTLEAMRYKMRDQSPIDLSMTKRSKFGSQTMSMWGAANLFRGFTVDG